ncbi:unnamed protein product [Vitrella brassicaformis CCMP3155]|uniref:Uncharacterized protein n=2 Tax=Vitrella brassicaformis TaxID=1169539 RepID=A0A0G4FC14_VITBC|nr:unnamed protein product [Vitrella brassicaformis CCMP3155]|eukprot:CEM10137.1 unnamed protein product [Vitrella brassicaformis CCMP3155]
MDAGAAAADVTEQPEEATPPVTPPQASPAAPPPAAAADSTEEEEPHTPPPRNTSKLSANSLDAAGGADEEPCTPPPPPQRMPSSPGQYGENPPDLGPSPVPEESRDDPTQPTELEHWHTLDIERLFVRKNKVREPLYRCPLCDVRTFEPAVYDELIAHYRDVHWRERVRIGEFTCFPCLKPDCNLPPLEDADSENAPIIRRSGRINKNPQFAGPPPARHWHCPLQAEGCDAQSYDVADLLQHCKEAHAGTRADPAMTGGQAAQRPGDDYEVFANAEDVARELPSNPPSEECAWRRFEPDTPAPPPRRGRTRSRTRLLSPPPPYAPSPATDPSDSDQEVPSPDLPSPSPPQASASASASLPPSQPQQQQEDQQQEEDGEPPQPPPDEEGEDGGLDGRDSDARADRHQDTSASDAVMEVSSPEVQQAVPEPPAPPPPPADPAPPPPAEAEASVAAAAAADDDEAPAAAAIDGEASMMGDGCGGGDRGVEGGRRGILKRVGDAPRVIQGGLKRKVGFDKQVRVRHFDMQLARLEKLGTRSGPIDLDDESDSEEDDETWRPRAKAKSKAKAKAAKSKPKAKGTPKGKPRPRTPARSARGRPPPFDDAAHESQDESDEDEDAPLARPKRTPRAKAQRDRAAAAKAKKRGAKGRAASASSACGDDDILPPPVDPQPIDVDQDFTSPPPPYEDRDGKEGDDGRAGSPRGVGVKRSRPRDTSTPTNGLCERMEALQCGSGDGAGDDGQAERDEKKREPRIKRRRVKKETKDDAAAMDEG